MNTEITMKIMQIILITSILLEMYIGLLDL